MALLKNNLKDLTNRITTKEEILALFPDDVQFYPGIKGSKQRDGNAEETWTSSNVFDYDGNIGILTGNYIVLDVDADAVDIRNLLNEHANTLEIKRENASDRTSFVYKVNRAPASTVIIPEGNSVPAIELKGVTKNKNPDTKLVYGDNGKGNYYAIPNPIKEIKFKELQKIWNQLREYYKLPSQQLVEAKFLTKEHAFHLDDNPKLNTLLNHYDMFEMVEDLGYGYTHRSGGWYQLEHPDFDSIHFNDISFSHKSQNVSGGIIKFYHYLQNGCSEDGFHLDNTVNEILKVKGISVRHIKTRKMYDKASLTEIQEYLLSLSEVELAKEKAILQKVAKVDAYLLDSYDITQLAKTKQHVDRLISARVKREERLLAYKLNKKPKKRIVVDLQDERSFIPEGILGEYIIRKEIGLLTADPNIGKSFWSLHLAMCMALGKNPWNGVESQKPRKVTYVFGEGGGGLRKRIAGMCNHHGIIKSPDNFFIYPEKINLKDGLGIDDFIDMLRASDFNPDLIIFDNFRTLSAGSDENSQVETGRFFDSILMLNEELNCASLVIHHNNKGGTYSGSTNIKGVVDWQISMTSEEVDKNKYGDELIRHVKTEKVRDSLPLPKHSFVVLNNDYGPYVREVNPNLDSTINRESNPLVWLAMQYPTVEFTVEWVNEMLDGDCTEEEIKEGLDELPIFNDIGDGKYTVNSEKIHETIVF